MERLGRGGRARSTARHGQGHRCRPPRTRSGRSARQWLHRDAQAGGCGEGSHLHGIPTHAAWLKTFLEGQGYAGRIACFNRSNSDPETRAILDAWERRHPDAKATGSRATNVRAAIVEHFRDHATLLIATEAGAEGLNLQFASLVVNYDLPWNPQRIEQRIGRCHRYGQRFDVVVISFLDQLNRADERVLELLTDKCQLSDGVFGASDEVLGAVESGVGLEMKIHRIFRTCRSPDAIEAAFAELRSEMDDVIKRREASARPALLDHFDADVHDKPKLRLDEARVRLDRIGRQFWALTRWALGDVADFPVDGYRFDLRHAPAPTIRPGRYELVSRESQKVAEAFVYRLSHPLGEHVLHAGLTTDTPAKRVVFDISSHPLKVSLVESLLGQSGWLTLERIGSINGPGPLQLPVRYFDEVRREAQRAVRRLPAHRPWVPRVRPGSATKGPH